MHRSIIGVSAHTTDILARMHRPIPPTHRYFGAEEALAVYYIGRSLAATKSRGHHVKLLLLKEQFHMQQCMSLVTCNVTQIGVHHYFGKWMGRKLI